MGKAGLFALAFFAMMTIAVASMVQFSGRREATTRAAERTALPATPPRRPGGLVIPVAGVRAGQIADTWGQSRDNGRRAHQGTDIVARGGTPVVAAASGTVVKLFDSVDGGRTVYIRSADGGWNYYYAHLADYAPGVREGLKVRAGQPIGFVGDTGNAGAGNYHLHFGVARMAPGDRWWQGTSVNPYPLLVGNGGRR